MNDEDDLLDRYRRASAAESSRPSDAARSAIAARARVEAAVRTLPAANDTHWRLRAAAGVAVLAVGALIVQRLSHYRHYEQQVASQTAQAVVETASVPPVAATPVVVEQASAELAAPAVPQRSKASARSERPSLASALPAALKRSVTIPSPAGMADAATKSAEAAAAAAVTGAVASAGADSAAVSTRATAITAAVLTRYFPDAFSAAGTAPPMWLLIDQNGRVVRSGRFASIEETRLRTHREQLIPGARIGEYQTVTVSDAKQRQATVAIFTLAADSPPLDPPLEPRP